MKQAFENYKIPTNEKKFSNERQNLIQDFVDRINSDRKGTTYKPATWTQINGLLKNKHVPYLYGFFKQCQNANCEFSKVFFGTLKRQRNNQ